MASGWEGGSAAPKPRSPGAVLPPPLPPSRLPARSGGRERQEGHRIPPPGAVGGRRSRRGGGLSGRNGPIDTTRREGCKADQESVLSRKRW